MEHMPRIALSVRQPSAWAIIAGHKPIENRTLGSIRAGRMGPGRICIHAAAGLKEEEFRYLHWRLGKHGVKCPAPADLPRGCIIGTVEVTGVITASDSEWFGGQAGLTLINPEPCDPIPAPGALGYFEWQAGGTLAAPAKWMTKWGTPDPKTQTNDLFPDAPIAFSKPPRRPW
ncbi:ASCH domain-containing protein [uncultured Tateyamaria sp.]|uniref:ASCH domain-containing protein n=2 Tax=Tateyamaria TaxID=299261 RepID=UPI00262393A8|nr:ASCH domain-containing protein [uncultured Tateyamaria sp.]